LPRSYFFANNGMVQALRGCSSVAAHDPWNGGGGVKKNFKRALVVLMVFLCLSTVAPKKADASVLGLTAAGISAAAAVPLSTVLLGMAGLAAVGAALYYQDDIISVGQKMAGEIALKGLLNSDFVDEATGAVTLNGDLVDAAAGSVYSMPKVRSIENSMVYDMNLIYSSKTTLAVIDMPILDTVNNRDNFSVTVLVNNPVNSLRGTYFTVYNKAGVELLKNYEYVGGLSSYTYSKMLYLTAADMPVSVKVEAVGGTVVAKQVILKDMTVPTKTITNKTVENAPTTVNDMQSYAYTNNVTNNTMMIDPAADMTGATVQDLYQTSYDNLNESVMQTGLLTKIWNGITSIPASVAAAGVAASAAINAKADTLWHDAGAVWTGLADTATGIKADVNAKMTALQSAMSGGIDNVRTNIDNMRLELGAGIDSLTATTATWFDNVGTRIDTGIDTLTGKLTDVWTGVAAIPAAVAAVPADIVTSLTDLAVPTAAQTAENNTNMSNTRLLLASKFEWIRIPIEEIKSLYGQRRSFFDVSVVIMGQEIVLLPAAYAATVAVVRNVMSGTMIMMTIIFIYRRVQPSDVV